MLSPVGYSLQILSSNRTNPNRRATHYQECDPLFKSDAQLVDRCLAGDIGAFDALYDRHAARVFHLLLRLAGNRANAEDILQETFLAAYRGLGAWRRQGAFSSWICGIAYRLVANHDRRHPLAQGLIAASNAHEMQSFAKPPDAGEIDFAARLGSAVDELPDVVRDTFLLVKVAGYSYAEVAEIQAIPIGTVRSRLHRAIGLLRSHFPEHCVELAKGVVCDEV
jgi:RNA polymerase sigma-70 factor (ECF subfamily)